MSIYAWLLSCNASRNKFIIVIHDIVNNTIILIANHLMCILDVRGWLVSPLTSSLTLMLLSKCH